MFHFLLSFSDSQPRALRAKTLAANLLAAEDPRPAPAETHGPTESFRATTRLPHDRFLSGPFSGSQPLYKEISATSLSADSIRIYQIGIGDSHSAQ